MGNNNLKSRKLEIKVRKDLGIDQKLLSQKEILELEPNLKPVFDAGIIYEDAMHAKDPHGILKEILNVNNIWLVLKFIFKKYEGYLYNQKTRMYTIAKFHLIFQEIILIIFDFKFSATAPIISL